MRREGLQARGIYKEVPRPSRRLGLATRQKIPYRLVVVDVTDLILAVVQLLERDMAISKSVWPPVSPVGPWRGPDSTDRPIRPLTGTPSVSVTRKFRLGPDRALAGSWQVPVRTVRRPQEGSRSSRISRVLARAQFADDKQSSSRSAGDAGTS